MGGPHGLNTWSKTEHTTQASHSLVVLSGQSCSSSGITIEMHIKMLFHKSLTNLHLSSFKMFTHFEIIFINMAIWNIQTYLTQVHWVLLEKDCFQRSTLMASNPQILLFIPLSWPQHYCYFSFVPVDLLEEEKNSFIDFCKLSSSNLWKAILEWPV